MSISMQSVVLAVALLAWSVAFAEAKPGFATKPTARTEKEGVRIEFALKQPTDVAVLIENDKGKVVRHLVAGVVGEKAPPPLKSGTLAQSILWDGKDDQGKATPAGSYTVRVGLGLEVSFERLIGYHPQWLGSINALAVGKSGELFVLCSRGICVLDRQGRYKRQIVPAPAGMRDEKLAGREPVKLADGMTFYRRGYPLPGSYITSIAVAPNGDLLLPAAGRYARKLIRVGADGSVPEGGFDKKLTALSDIGFLYLACSPDGKVLYMSGAEAGYMGDDAREVSYRQVVYRLWLDSDGPSEIFTGDDENTGPPGFRVSRPKGLATDPEGFLYVCNYGRGDVAVYTPNGGMVRTIPVERPQQVAVHPSTGQVYVLAGKESGYRKYGYNYPARMHEAILYRFSREGKKELELKLDDAWMKTRDGVTRPEYRLRMAVDFSGRRPIVWIGVAYPGAEYAKWVLSRIEDEGEKFSEPHEVCPKPEGVLTTSARHMWLDRERDIVYVNHGSAQLDRFTGDGKALPPLKLRNPKTGKKFNICEIAIGPEGMIYLLGWREWGYRDNFVQRFDREGKPLPLPAVGEDGIKIWHAMKGGSGRSTRGFTVAPNGDIYVMYYDDKRPKELLPPEPWDRGFSMTVAVAHYGADGSLKNPRLIAHLRRGGQGVRVDRAGNVYVGENIMPLGVSFPRDFVGVLPDPLKRPYPARLADGSYDPLLRHMGSVFKFGPQGGKVVGLPEGKEYPLAKRPAGDLWRPAPAVQWYLFHNQRLQVSGALWQYHGISPVPAQYQGVTHVERCVCLGARFDLDQFDRVFVPDALRHRVTVLDSCGNVVTRFGEYGNQDSAGPGIGLSEPGWVAAAADRVYIGDGGAYRIVKVKLGYASEAGAKVSVAK